MDRTERIPDIFASLVFSEDVMRERLPKDVYKSLLNTIATGTEIDASIADVVDKLAGRIECVHLKDYKLFENKDALAGFEPRFAPVGDGTIDFKSLIPQMQAAGVKYFLVEQDNAADLPDSLGQVERSIKYLKENF